MQIFIKRQGEEKGIKVGQIRERRFKEKKIAN